MKQFIKCPKCGQVQLYDDKLVSARQHKCINCKEWLLEGQCVPIPALSIKQPWAWLIVKGLKDIENRNTLKNFTGNFLIHAGEQVDWTSFYALAYHRPHISMVDRMTPDPDQIDIFRTSGIIGHATITGFVEKSDSPWFVGKYGLLIKDPKPLPFTPCKGKLSFFYPEID